MTGGTGLWMVTPAWQRAELSAVCLEQHRRVIDELASRGLEAHCVVVADDENLDTARALGFDTVERDNDWLGRKFNDGQEWAGRHGAEWIVPLGSDSFVMAEYFLGPLPAPGSGLTSRMYAPVEPGRLAELDVAFHGAGAGPHVFHRADMEAAGFRPAPDEISRNTDHNTILGVQAAIGRPLSWSFRDLHPLQYAGFRHPPFITRYDRLVQRWGRAERRDPWERLAEVYDADLVARARALMEALP